MGAKWEVAVVSEPSCCAAAFSESMSPFSKPFSPTPHHPLLAAAQPAAGGHLSPAPSTSCLPADILGESPWDKQPLALYSLVQFPLPSPPLSSSSILLHHLLSPLLPLVPFPFLFPLAA